MQETSEQLCLGICQKQKCTASDFHARLSVLLETEKVSRILEALSFLRSCGWLKSESLTYYSQKMSKGFSTTMKAEPSEQSSEQWMNWGTMSNGKYVTANTSGYPKTGKESSLSDIIEGGGHTRKILPLDTDYTEADELPGYEIISNTLGTRIEANTRGSYLVRGGGYAQSERIPQGLILKKGAKPKPTNVTCTLDTKCGSLPGFAAPYVIEQ